MLQPRMNKLLAKPYTQMNLMSGTLHQITKEIILYNLCAHKAQTKLGCWNAGRGDI